MEPTVAVAPAPPPPHGEGFVSLSRGRAPSRAGEGRAPHGRYREAARSKASRNSSRVASAVRGPGETTDTHPWAA